MSSSTVSVRERGGELQGVQRLIGSDDEGVRAVHRKQHEVARAGVKYVVIALEPGVAGQDVEGLVLVEVAV